MVSATQGCVVSYTSPLPRLLVIDNCFIVDQPPRKEVLAALELNETCQTDLTDVCMPHSPRQDRLPPVRMNSAAWEVLFRGLQIDIQVSAVIVG